MRLALREAARAPEHDDVPVGAVVVHGGEVIGAGHNERELRADPTAHAEMIALREAARAARQLARARLRDVRHARAVRDVRRRDRAGPSAPARVRGHRSQGGRRRKRARRARRAPPEPPTPGRERPAGRGMRRPAAGVLRAAPALAPADRVGGLVPGRAGGSEGRHAGPGAGGRSGGQREGGQFPPLTTRRTRCRRILSQVGSRGVTARELVGWGLASCALVGLVTSLLVRGPASSAGSGVVGLNCRSTGGACARSREHALCARAPSLTSVRDPRVGCGAGDMMFDRVIPLGEALRPLGLSGPSTWAWRAGGCGEPAAAICVMKGLARTGKVMRA